MTSLDPSRGCSVGLLLAAVVSTPVFGLQDPVASRPAAVLADKAPYELRLDHVSGRLKLHNHKGELLEQWETRGVARATAPLARIPPDRPLLVVVENANSLLYDFTTSATSVGERRNIRSCTDIGASFTSQAFLSSVAAIGNVTGLQAQDPEPLFTGAMFSDYARQLRAAALGDAQARGQMTEEAVATRLGVIRTSLQELVVFTETLEELAVSLPDSLRRVAMAADATPINSLLETLSAHLKAIDGRLTNPTLVTQVIQERLAAAEEPAIELFDMNALLASNRLGIDSRSAVATDLRALGGRLDEALDGIDGWTADLQRSIRDIERARELSVQGFSTTASGGNFRRVAVEASDANRLEDVVGIRAGRVEIYTEPRVSMNCRISLGFGMMDNPPDYVVRDGTIANDRSENLRTAATLNLHLGPNNVPIAAMIGIGIGVESAPDFYAGGSLSFLSPVLLNAGVVFQRQQRLPDGLGIGDPADESLLDRIDRRYAAAFFAGISLAP